MPTTIIKKYGTQLRDVRGQRFTNFKELRGRFLNNENIKILQNGVDITTTIKSKLFPVQETLIIKRYSNRKLYNTLTNANTTMVELGDLMKEGRKIQVIDNTTKQDVTKVILLKAAFFSELAELRD